MAFLLQQKKKPTVDFDDWERFNAQLIAYLQAHMHPTLQHHLDDIKTTKAAWELLKSKFREKGTVGQFNLLQMALHT
jgi:hypothetical protein